MSYFDELGGDDASMSAPAFAAMAPHERALLVEKVAQMMAPAILARVEVVEGGVELVGRYGVHVVNVRVDATTGALSIRVRPRRKLAGPARTIHGNARHPSRVLLSELPHGTGDLLNRLLDSFSEDGASLTIEPEQLLLELRDANRMLLSRNAAQRLHSVTHLCAYIASEAETRWPEDPDAPLAMPPVEPHGREWQDLNGDGLAPPVPGYGIPPGHGS